MCPELQKVHRIMSPQENTVTKLRPGGPTLGWSSAPSEQRNNTRDNCLFDFFYYSFAHKPEGRARARAACELHLHNYELPRNEGNDSQKEGVQGDVERYLLAHVWTQRSLDSHVNERDCPQPFL